MSDRNRLQNACCAIASDMARCTIVATWFAPTLELVGGFARNDSVHLPLRHRFASDAMVRPIERRHNNPIPAHFAADSRQQESPSSEANNLFFISTDATTNRFINELLKPIAAVGFIGHSFDIDTLTTPPTPPYAVGLRFTDAGQALVRPSQPSDNPGYITTETGTNVVPVPLVAAQARVIFVGACYISPFFESWWNILPSTTGQVLIVPANPSSSTNLLHATYAWENVLQVLLDGSHKTVGQAVLATNGYMSKLGYSEQWKTIGDASVTFK